MSVNLISNLTALAPGAVSGGMIGRELFIDTIGLSTKPEDGFLKTGVKTAANAAIRFSSVAFSPFNFSSLLYSSVITHPGLALFKVGQSVDLLTRGEKKEAVKKAGEATLHVALSVADLWLLTQMGQTSIVYDACGIAYTIGGAVMDLNRSSNSMHNQLFPAKNKRKRDDSDAKKSDDSGSDDSVPVNRNKRQRLDPGSDSDSVGLGPQYSDDDQVVLDDGDEQSEEFIEHNSSPDMEMDSKGVEEGSASLEITSEDERDSDVAIDFKLRAFSPQEEELRHQNQMMRSPEYDPRSSKYNPRSPYPFRGTATPLHPPGNFTSRGTLQPRASSVSLERDDDPENDNESSRSSRKVSRSSSLFSSPFPVNRLNSHSDTNERPNSQGRAGFFSPKKTRSGVLFDVDKHTDPKKVRVVANDAPNWNSNTGKKKPTKKRTREVIEIN